MPRIAGLDEFLLKMAVVVAVATLIGVVFLRAAIALYNKMAGGATSPRSVPVPEFEKAAAIVFVIAVLQMGVRFLIGRIVVGKAMIAGMDEKQVGVVALLTNLPVGLLVMALVLTVMLPTTFGRAVLVTLCYMFLVIIVVGVLMAIAITLLGSEFILSAV
jgi:hypothetical protein